MLLRIVQLDTRILGFHSDRFISLHQNVYKSNGRCATNKYFQIIGSIHDIESYFRIDNTSSLNVQIFFCHFGHLAIIFGAGATEVFHIGWNGGFSRSLKNPIARIPIAHGIGDPHFGNPISEAYSSPKSYYRFLLSFSGIYNWLYTVGFNTVFDVYNFVITHEFLGVTFIRIGNLHLIYSCQFTMWVALNKGIEIFSSGDSLMLGYAQLPLPKGERAMDIKVHPIFIWPCKFFVAYFDCLRLTFINFWVGRVIAPLSGAWSAHYCVNLNLNLLGSETGCALLALCQAFYTGDWLSYHSTILTFLGGLKSNRISLYLTDIAHHHFGVALLFLWQHALSSSLYKALQAFSLRTVRANKIGYRSEGRSKLSGLQNATLSSLRSVYLHLSLGLGGGGASIAGVGTSLTPLTPYLYLSYDYLTCSALDLHHSSIALFLMIGSFAHGGILLIRDVGYPFGHMHHLSFHLLKLDLPNVFRRILICRAALISHLT